MSRAARVVHVTTIDASLELLLGPQLRAFAAAGYEVYGASAPGPHVQTLEDDGIRHAGLRHATRAMHPSQDAAALRELYRLFRRLQPDIVHTHNPKPGVYGRIAARAARVPVIVNTVHGLYAQPHDRLVRRAAVYGLERLAATCSHAELVQNPEDVETLRRLRVPAAKLRLLGNGVDLARFTPTTASEPVRRLRQSWGAGPETVVCGTVGRLVWEKGFAELFDAAELVRERAPHVRFVVAGPFDPQRTDAMSEEAVERARRSGVTFLGMRDDMEDLYAAMDMFVLPSHREGFPRSAMEAAATGLPIVATDIRGCRQVVEPGRTGLLVPLSDAPRLAEAIVELANDERERHRMGRAARQKAVAEFDQQRVIDTTLEVYERLLRDASTGASQPRAHALDLAGAANGRERS